MDLKFFKDLCGKEEFSNMIKALIALIWIITFSSVFLVQIILSSLGLVAITITKYIG